MANRWLYSILYNYIQYKDLDIRTINYSAHFGRLQTILHEIKILNSILKYLCINNKRRRDLFKINQKLWKIVRFEVYIWIFLVNGRNEILKGFWGLKKIFLFCFI